MMVPDRTIVRGITVKNLKPSQLPELTVIETHIGEYIKRADGIWEDLFSGCGCCEPHERISDAGCESIWDGVPGLHHRLTTTTKSDDYFPEYKVIATDPEYTFSDEAIHGKWVMEKQVYSDGMGEHFCKGYNCEE